MKSNKNYSLNSFSAHFVGILFIFIITFYTAINISNSDLSHHADWSQQLSIRHLLSFMQDYVSYPLWHILTKFCYKILNFSLGNAAAFSTAVFNCFVYCCIVYVWNFFTVSPVASPIKAFWTCCLLMVGPLYAPWFSEYYYLGQGSGNTWHNPTNIAVKGFSILCFALIVRLIESPEKIKENIRKYILLSMLLLCSVLAKPSFLLGIIPGLGMYFIISGLIKRKKEVISNYCLIAACFIPSVALLLYQFIVSFFVNTAIHGGGQIGIEFGRVLKNWSPNLLISFLLAFAFPLFILAIDFKNLMKKTHIQLVICYEFCAWVEGAFLYENGRREFDGNWLWGSYLSMFAVWILFFFHYFNIISDERQRPLKKLICLYGGGILLFSHLTAGIFYWYTITHGGQI